MDKVIYEDNKIIFQFEKYKAGCIFFGFFSIFFIAGIVLLVVSGVQIKALDGNFFTNLINIYFVNKDEYMVILVLLLFGVTLIIMIPLAVVVLIKQSSNNTLPDKFILDLSKKEFQVYETEKNGSLSAGVSFDEIADFQLRWFTESSNKSRITYYTVCMVKKDGAYWDIFCSSDKSKVETVLDKIRSSLTLNIYNYEQENNDAVLPKIITRLEKDSKIIFYWANKNYVTGFILGFIFMLFFTPTFLSVFKIMIPGLIIGTLVFGFIWFFMIKRFIGTVKDKYNFDAIVLSDNMIKSGEISKKTFELSTEKEMALSDVYEVVFNFDYEMEKGGAGERVIEIIKNTNKNSFEDLKAGKFNIINYLETNLTSTNEDKNLYFYTYGLLCSEIILFEKYLQREIKI